jgi:hypothetical protein
MKQTFPHRLVLTILLLLSFSSPAALAQVTYGSLRGVVKDAQGAALSGVSVTIKNLQTNDTLLVKTDGSGTFEAPSLPPGRYSVSIAHTGFKTSEVRPVVVETARPSNIDVKMEVSQVTEAVTVKGSDAQADVNVSSPEVSTVLSRQQLLSLPMVRNPFIIVSSLAGINPPSPSGLRGTSTNITQDGINVADHFNRFAFGVNTTVITDNTAEISISTNTIGATGGFGVSQIRVVTPSGANRPSGSVYWYHTNSALDANTFSTIGAT